MAKEKYNHGILRSERGTSSITNLISTILVLAIVAALYLFVPPYFNNWKLKNILNGIGTQTTSVSSSEKVELLALSELNKQGYDFTPKDLTVEKQGKSVRLRVEYETIVEIPLTEYTITLSFVQTGGS